MILHRDFRVDKEKLKNVKELCTIPFSDIFNTALDWIDDDLDFSNKIFSVYVQRFIDITCQNNTFQAPFFSEHPKKLFL